MSDHATVHRWAVDSIEEGIARVEQDGAAMLTVPVWLLPAGTKEGQVLSVSASGSAGSCNIQVTLDAAGTAAALAASSASVDNMAKASRKRDGGGNVSL